MDGGADDLAISMVAIFCGCTYGGSVAVDEASNDEDFEEVDCQHVHTHDNEVVG